MKLLNGIQFGPRLFLLYKMLPLRMGQERKKNQVRNKPN